MLNYFQPEVRFGSIATERGSPPPCLLSPDSDRTADIAGGPFSAMALFGLSSMSDLSP
jgi:hypothetical protein